MRWGLESANGAIRQRTGTSMHAVGAELFSTVLVQKHFSVATFMSGQRVSAQAKSQCMW
jgi:hypothetical protein